jgi:hypothetical protein
MDRVIETPLPELTDEQRRARETAARRMADFVARRDALREERRSQVDEWEKSNVAIARAVRARYDAGEQR